MFKKTALLVILASLPAGYAQFATAAGLSDQWYAGVGAAQGLLKPVAEENGVTREEEVGDGATLFFGRDFDNRSSGQVQLYSLGDAMFSDGNTATYTAADASLLYRFYDSRDHKLNATFGVSIYGRFGVGAIERDSTTPLNTDGSSSFYFGAGGGFEAYLTDMFALRSEVLFHEEDTLSASVSVVARFGGKRNRSVGFIPPSLPTASPTNAMSSQALLASGSSPQPSYSQPQAVQISGANGSSRNTQIAYPSSPTRTLADYVDVNKTPYREDYRKTTGDMSADPSSNVYRENYRNTLIEGAKLAAANEYRAGNQNQGDDEPDNTSSNEYSGGFNREVNNVSVQESSTSQFRQTERDSDGDGVSDSFDQCNQSNRNYPVTLKGCSVFEQIGPQITFSQDSAVLVQTTEQVLRSLAAKLNRFPNTRIELIAHTDNSGDPRVKSSLARQRLRTIGAYLKEQGISQNRFLLRSFGGERPAYANSTVSGRQANNRIEILEKP